jgi:hypothetical protein
MLVAAPGWGQQSTEQPLNAKLAAVSASYSLNVIGLLDALMKTAGDFQLPIGIEWIRQADPTARFIRSWQHSDLSTILRDIVKSVPGYELEITNGVVHVFHTAVHGDRSNILNTRIGTFQVNNEPVMFAAYRLAVQVRRTMVPPDPNRPPIGRAASISSGDGDRPVTFTIEDATVRDVLDKLCLSAGLNVWVVAYPAEPAKTRGGFLKTVPLHGGVQEDDDYFLPDWNFLKWGQPF